MNNEKNRDIKELLWRYNIQYEEIAVRIGVTNEKFHRMMQKELSKGNRRLVRIAIRWIIKEEGL